MKKHNADDALRDFWQNNKNFADLFNAHFDDMPEKVRPEELYDVPPGMTAVTKDGKAVLLHEGDVAKLWKTQNIETILIAENQTYIDYGMPIRELVGRAVVADQQRRKKMQERRENGKLGRDEFLSGWKKEDRYIPSRTLTVYYGRRPWDAPLNFEDLQDTPKEVMGTKYNPNGVNLLDIRNLDLQSLQMNEESRDLFSLVQLYQETPVEKMSSVIGEYLQKHDVSEAVLVALERVAGDNKKIAELIGQITERYRKMDMMLAEMQDTWESEINSALAREALRERSERQRLESEIAKERGEAAKAIAKERDEAARARDEAAKLRVRNDEVARSFARLIWQRNVEDGTPEAETAAEIAENAQVSIDTARSWLNEFNAE